MVDNTVIERVGGVADSYRTVDGWRSGRVCSDRARLFHSAAT
jgi:hypothetical protein